MALHPSAVNRGWSTPFTTECLALRPQTSIGLLQLGLRLIEKGYAPWRAGPYLPMHAPSLGAHLLQAPARLFAAGHRARDGALHQAKHICSGDQNADMSLEPTAYVPACCMMLSSFRIQNQKHAQTP